MVKSGALACVSVSNTQLGERSAEMAYDILNGKDVSEVPAEAMSDFQYVCSRAAADALSIALPGGRLGNGDRRLRRRKKGER